MKFLHRLAHLLGWNWLPPGSPQLFHLDAHYGAVVGWRCLTCGRIATRGCKPLWGPS